MYRLKVGNLNDQEIRRALGILVEESSYDEFPPPPKLRRTYKTLCPLCGKVTFSIIQGERRSVCSGCDRYIGKLALTSKVNRQRAERLQVRTAISYAVHRTPLGGSRDLQSIILGFLY